MAVALVANAPVRATGLPYGETFQFFLELCKQPVDENGGLDALCLGYVKGTAAVLTMNGYLHDYKLAMCISDSYAPTGAALVQAVINYGNAHPETWAQSKDAGVWSALSSTWPCPN